MANSEIKRDAVGNVIVTDKDGHTIAIFDGTLRSLNVPSGAALQQSGTTVAGPSGGTAGEVWTSNGAGAVGSFQAAAGASIAQQATVLLTAAQVRGLPTSAVEIVAAPGANKIVYPTFVAWHCNWAVDFANVDSGAQLRVLWTGGDSAGPLVESQSAVSGLLIGGGPDGVNAFSLIRQRIVSSLSVGLSGYYDSDIANSSLSISASNASAGDFTEGTGSTLRVTVEYRVFNFSTGLFEAA